MSPNRGDLLFIARYFEVARRAAHDRAVTARILRTSFLSNRDFYGLF
jgi:hypothetical protein